MAKVTRRTFLLVGSLAAIGILGFGRCSNGKLNSDGENPFQLIAAFHSATGINEPTEYGNGNQEDINTATTNLAESESTGGTKTIVVAAKIIPDKKRNFDVGDLVELTTGERYSGATLVIDDTNEYSDVYDINQRDWKSAYLESGFHDGGDLGTVYAGSVHDYKVVFAFWIGNQDYENGKEASLRWGDYSLSFNINDIQEAGTPNEILKQLQASPLN